MKSFNRLLFLRRRFRCLRLKKTHPDWTSILKSKEFPKKRTQGKEAGTKVLIATSVGAHLPATILESMLSVALSLREADPHILLCDSALPACLDCVRGQTIGERNLSREGPAKKLCKSCVAHGRRVFSPLGFPIHWYSEYLNDEDKKMAKEISAGIPRNEIESFTFEGYSVGEHSMAGTLRYYARGTLLGTSLEEIILRRYLEASLLMVRILEKLHSREKFKVALFHHGIYIPQGIIGDFCRKNGIRVVNWNPAYRRQCFIFSHGDTYHHTLMNEPTDIWETIEWNHRLESKVSEYLKSRWQGSQDWIYFHENPREDIDWICQKLEISKQTSCIGLLTNVFWDAQLHYPDNAFKNMMEWIIETIRYFQSRPEIKLLIRIHPAEIRGSIPSRQPVVDEIKRDFPVLPGNIIIIPPESSVSTYALMEMCDSVIIYGTKTGVELTSQGIPVIVAGEAWIRNKGITIDTDSREEYFSVLDQLPLREKMGEGEINRAKMYAFHFFFRRMIPISNIQPKKGWPPYFLKDDPLEALTSGKDPGLDIVCNGILSGTPFIYPAELLSEDIDIN